MSNKWKTWSTTMSNLFSCLAVYSQEWNNTINYVSFVIFSFLWAVSSGVGYGPGGGGSTLKTPARVALYLGTPISEKKAYVGLQIAMPLCAKPAVQDYWRLKIGFRNVQKPSACIADTYNKYAGGMDLFNQNASSTLPTQSVKGVRHFPIHVRSGYMYY